MGVIVTLFFLSLGKKAIAVLNEVLLTVHSTTRAEKRHQGKGGLVSLTVMTMDPSLTFLQNQLTCIDFGTMYLNSMVFRPTMLTVV